MDARPQRIDNRAVGLREVAQRRQPPGYRHVAQEHLVPRILARRPELGQSLGPPQGERHVVNPRVTPQRFAGDAELEDVDQLVADRVTEVVVAPVEGQRHPLLQKLRDTQQAFRRHEREDVGLLEVGMRRVNDQRNATRDVVIEALLQDLEARFGVGQRDPPELLFFRIVVEVHMLAAQHVPIEAPVLDLVLTEGTELCRRDAGQERDREHRPPQMTDGHR